MDHTGNGRDPWVCRGWGERPWGEMTNTAPSKWDVGWERPLDSGAHNGGDLWEEREGVVERGGAMGETLGWGGGGKGKRALSTGGGHREGAPGGTPGHQGGNGRDPKEQWEAMGEALGAEGVTGETPRDGVCDGRPQR